MIVLPSETQSREFDAKLLLACMLAEKQLPTVVGSRIAIHNSMHRLSPAIYIAKDFRKASSRIFRILGGLGAAILAWDEEGLLNFDQALYNERRVHAPTLALVKEFFAWGPANRKLIAGANGYHGQPIHLFGNPRIDMLRPELRDSYGARVRLLREQYGHFVLVNTNFGQLNHFLPGYVAKPGGYDKRMRAAMTPRMTAAWTHLGRVFEAFKSMIVPLADAFPERMIVVRPHPGENLETWRQAAQGRKNVIVIHEGPVQPWLLACAAMVHSSCTTGMEAYLLGAPVISYRPFVSDVYDHKISNDLSHEVFSQEDLLAALAQALRGETLDRANARRVALAQSLFSSLEGELASERIAARVAELAAQRDFFPRTTWMGRQQAKLHSAGRAGLRLATSRLPNHKHGKRYSSKRFPGVSLSEVETRIADFRRSLGRFETVSAVQFSENIFLVS
jgi:surface carbohydrate biosynthesis protein